MTTPTDNSKKHYVITAGKKYHSVTCRYLVESATEIAEKDAPARGCEPSLVCISSDDDVCEPTAPQSSKHLENKASAL
jgi:hypothetical protein